MAQLAASNVTYAMVEGSRLSNACDPRNSAIFAISFGDGTATYASGGVPLTKAKLGCPATIQDFVILSPNADGIVYKYNHTAETLQMYRHLHDTIMAGGVTTTADFLYHSSGAIGKAAATNVTISGTASATLGGVVPASLAAAQEVSTAAVVQATTIRVRVAGW